VGFGRVHLDTEMDHRHETCDNGSDA